MPALDVVVAARAGVYEAATTDARKRAMIGETIRIFLKEFSSIFTQGANVVAY